MRRSLRSRLAFAVLAAACLVPVAPAVARTYEVGPERDYKTPITVPWEDLVAGDVVEIHPSPQPYRVKWVLCVAGTAEQPIVIRGIRDAEGNRPVIEAEDAITPPRLVYNGGARSLLKIGAASVPKDRMPEHIVLEGLAFQGAREGTLYYGRRGRGAYVGNAAGLFIEKGRHITVRDCRFSQCGNGIFVAPTTAHLRFERCVIEGNGREGSIYEHNVYTSAVEIEFAGCYFGPLAEGALGNNLKDRSAGLVVRNCWIEGGNRQLDLVDAEDADWITREPAYRETWVVGNVLIEFEPRLNNQIIHYGGDSGATDRYRKGRLRLWHNTILSKRPKATVLRLSTPDETADLRHNILYTINGGAHLALLDDVGRVEMRHNWIRRGFKQTFASRAGVFDIQDTITDTHPGFVDLDGDDLRLQPGGSAALAARRAPDEVPWQAETGMQHEFRLPNAVEARTDVGWPSPGAYSTPADE